MSLHQGAAALIVGRLHLEIKISQKVITQTQSALRILKIKSPNGTFGKQDNDLKRACALLEYSVREKEGFKIPMARLAKAACMKERDFVKFHQIIGNFRANASSTSKRSSSSKGGDNSNKTGGPRRSSIPSLAIKLGSFVQDSNGDAIRAQKLYDQIIHDAECKASDEGRHQVGDMKQHQQTYEAACFYLVATKDKTRNMSSKIADDDDGRQLEISTLVDLSTDFTSSEFKNVLEHVKTILEKKENHQESSCGNGGGKATTRTLAMKRKSTRTLGEVSGKRSKPSVMLSSQQLASNATLDLLKKVDHTDVSRVYNDPLTESSLDGNYSAMFLQWKSKVLAKAVDAAKTALLAEARQQDVGEISREKALDRAATDVLRSHGLLL
jgi:hypothetical protein